MSDDTDYDYEGYASWAVDLVEQWRKDSNSIAIEPIDQHSFVDLFLEQRVQGAQDEGEWTARVPLEWNVRNRPPRDYFSPLYLGVTPMMLEFLRAVKVKHIVELGEVMAHESSFSQCGLVHMLVMVRRKDAIKKLRKQDWFDQLFKHDNCFLLEACLYADDPLASMQIAFDFGFIYQERLVDPTILAHWFLHRLAYAFSLALNRRETHERFVGMCRTLDDMYSDYVWRMAELYCCEFLRRRTNLLAQLVQEIRWASVYVACGHVGTLIAAQSLTLCPQSMEVVESCSLLLARHKSLNRLFVDAVSDVDVPLESAQAMYKFAAIFENAPLLTMLEGALKYRITETTLDKALAHAMDDMVVGTLQICLDYGTIALESRPRSLEDSFEHMDESDFRRAQMEDRVKEMIRMAAKAGRADLIGNLGKDKLFDMPLAQEELDRRAHSLRAPLLQLME